MRLFKRDKQPADTLSGSLEYSTLKTPTLLVSRPDPQEPGVIPDYWDVDWCIWKDDDGSTPADGHCLNLTKARDDNKNSFVHLVVECGYSVGSIPTKLFLLAKKHADGQDVSSLTDSERERLGMELRDARYETSDSEDDSVEAEEVGEYTERTDSNSAPLPSYTSWPKAQAEVPAVNIVDTNHRPENPVNSGQEGLSHNAFSKRKAPHDTSLSSQSERRKGGRKARFSH